MVAVKRTHKAARIGQQWNKQYMRRRQRYDAVHGKGTHDRRVIDEFWKWYEKQEGD